MIGQNRARSLAEGSRRGGRSLVSLRLWICEAPDAGPPRFPARAIQRHSTVVVMAEAEQFKTEGNDLYKKGDYQGAIEKYTQAIDAAPTIVAYYGNRAAALFMLGKHKDVITDCNRAIVFDPTYFKGYVRKAKAQLALVSAQ